MKDRATSPPLSGPREDTTQPRFEALDGLRALAFGSVFVYHFGLPVRPLMAWGGVGYRIIPNMDLGVEIFFVLSGFLIFRPFAVANLRALAFPNLTSYVIRRVLRVYPAYWFALTVFLLLGEVEIHGGAKRVFAHYALLHTYLPEDLRYAFDGLGPSWSLVVEVSFYAFVPVLALTLRRFALRGHLWVVGGLTAGGFAARLVTIRHPLTDAFGGWAKSFVGVLPFALAALGPGMALAVLSVQPPAWTRRWFRVRWPWWCAAAGCVLAMMVLAPTSTDAPFRLVDSSSEAWHRMLTPILATALVAPYVLGPSSSATRPSVLRSRVLVAVGVVSYGAYLWHHPLLLDSKGDRVHLSYLALADASLWRIGGLFIGFLALTLAVATVSYRCIEQPAQNLARRLTRQLRH